MDKQQSTNLIRRTFTSKFNKPNYIHFTKELLNLNRIDVSKAQSWNHTYVKDAFKPWIDRFERIATYTDPQKKKIDILIVYLNEGKETSLERARTLLRSFVADYLKNRGEKDAGLVAFVSPNEEDWRFSFVKMEYALVCKESGKVKAETKLTPAKRYSFLVGEHENSHTAQKQLLPLLQETDKNPTLDEIEQAFSVDKVTKEFFERYKELCLNLNDELEKLIKKDKGIRDDFTEKGISIIDFAKKLMGQIVFLYFIQKKGWLGVDKGADWGTGPKNFLRRLFDGERINYKSFFNDVLESLFYYTLATDRGHESHCKTFQCKIPFLNGGLFEPIGGYDWRKTHIVIPDELFSNNTETKDGKGTGILDVFDRFNFTVKEDEPLEKEVAIDPEMLGKVFENLLEVKERKSKGSYYTPREIVHYMCQQSLISYLYTELNPPPPSSFEKMGVKQIEIVGNEVRNGQRELLIEHRDAPAIPKEDIEKLIKSGEQASFFEAARMAGTGYRRELPKSIIENAKLIDEKLKDIAVCDPAVGSGAFLVGMMTEIVKAKESLTPYFNDYKERTPYYFKRHAIQNCLYGVDIDLGAVEIAKLRLWLSLVVDEEDVKHIKPLPNLDYKIVCGNSLFGVEKNLLNYPIFAKLEELKPLYFNETDADKKHGYKKQIDELISEITNGRKDFDFEVYFSEVFHEKGGFDVVIANPPYLKERDSKKVFENINKTEWGKKWHQGKMDFWYFFLHRAIDIIKKSGAISFITSRYWLNSTGAKNLVRRIRDELSFAAFVDIGKLKVFDEVAGQHMVAIYTKDNQHQEFFYKKLENNLSDISKDENTDNLVIKTLKNSELFSEDDQIELEVDELTYAETTPLGSIFDVSQGVVQNPDKVSKKMATKYKLPAGRGVFVLSEDELNTLNLNRREQVFVRMFFDEHDIYKYFVRARRNKYLLYLTKENCPDILQYPNLKMHLEKYKKIMLDRRETKRGLNKWFHLHWPRKNQYFESPKIVLPAMFNKPLAAYQEEDSYFGLSSNVIIKKDSQFELKYLLAILNSSFAQYWFCKHGKKRGVGVDIGVDRLRKFPVKKAAGIQQKEFISIANKILAITKGNDYLQNQTKQSKVREHEKQIDQLVYKLYGLTDEKIKIVEGYVKN